MLISTQQSRIWLRQVWTPYSWPQIGLIRWGQGPDLLKEAHSGSCLCLPSHHSVHLVHQSYFVPILERGPGWQASDEWGLLILGSGKYDTNSIKHRQAASCSYILTQADLWAGKRYNLFAWLFCFLYLCCSCSWFWRCRISITFLQPQFFILLLKIPPNFSSAPLFLFQPSKFFPQLPARTIRAHCLLSTRLIGSEMAWTKLSQYDLSWVCWVLGKG